MSDAAALIARLGLERHPEGGWYRETFRQPAVDPDGRGLATAILFLLEEGQRSHWHRVDGAELWLWHAGAPLALLVHDGAAGEYRLGGDVLAGEVPQALVPSGARQSAEAGDGWTFSSAAW